MEEKYKNILNAIRTGNVPAHGASSICMGRDNEINEFENLLEDVSEGKAFAKFINGEFGAGKSFFLKVIEDLAYEKNFAVSMVTVSNNMPFNKIDVVYKNVAGNLECKTGTSLEHFVTRWITGLKMDAFNQSSDPQEQNNIIRESISIDLTETRKINNSFANTIEKYNQLINAGDIETANAALAWLSGDSNIPFTTKRRFGIKGNIDKENAINYLKALSTFVSSIGYSGLVVLIDESEFIMNLANKKLRDIAYNYIRDILDGCSLGKFKNSLYIFAGTPEWYEDPKVGVKTYGALYDRISDTLDGGKNINTRKPIFNLRGFDKNDLKDVSKQMMEMHSVVYGWDANKKFDPIMDEIIERAINDASLTEGEVTPRIFIKKFLEALDYVEQNQNNFKTSDDILNLFNFEEKPEWDFNENEEKENDVFDDW